MPHLPVYFEQLLRQHLQEDSITSRCEVCHVRSGNRGVVLRLPRETGGSVVFKVWPIKNWKQQIKAGLRVSNAWREWRTLCFLQQKNILAPEPLYFRHLIVSAAEQYEVIGMEDLGDVVSGRFHLKRLIASGEESAVETFENALVTTTAEMVRLSIVDLDHHLNNFLVDNIGGIIPIDFECARRPWSRRTGRGKLTEMISRFLVSHIRTVQPDVWRTIHFAERLYKELEVDQQMRYSLQYSVSKRLGKHHPREDSVLAVNLS